MYIHLVMWRLKDEVVAFIQSVQEDERIVDFEMA